MPGAQRIPLIVYSHLRWDLVHERPRQLMTRLAAGGRVLFVEEPQRTGSAAAHANCLEIASGLEVLQPHTPERASGFAPEQLPPLRRLLQDALLERGIARHMAWLTTPMARTLALSLVPQGLVYDCMEDLAAQTGAPAMAREEEQALLQTADLVFTAGPALYRALRDQHPRVYCFPSSVDVAHFARGRDPSAEAEELRPLPRPRLGFHGLVDERLDLALLAALAEAHPDWSVVVVGPVGSLDAATLPRRDNLHWLGPRAHDALPALLAGWDVGLLPFACRGAAGDTGLRRALEYMAAEKPIASTPLPGVAASYGDIVHFGDTPEAFVAACERALAEPPVERALRAAAMRRVLAGSSWDETAHGMDMLLRGLELPHRRPAPPRAPQPGGQDAEAPAWH